MKWFIGGAYWSTNQYHINIQLRKVYLEYFVERPRPRISKDEHRSTRKWRLLTETFLTISKLNRTIAIVVTDNSFSCLCNDAVISWHFWMYDIFNNECQKVVSGDLLLYIQIRRRLFWIPLSGAKLKLGAKFKKTLIDRISTIKLFFNIIIYLFLFIYRCFFFWGGAPRTISAFTR